MLHNEDLLILNHNLKITKKEHYFLCESSSGKSLKFGNFSDNTYIFEKKENNCKKYEWEEKIAFYIMSPDFVIASPKNLHQRVWRFSDALPSTLSECIHPCSEVA